MPNVFDQFDAPAPQGGNVFDQFDTAPAAQPKPTWNWSQLGNMAVNDILNLPHNLYQGIASAVTLPGDVASGVRAVPQSANMPGGENTSEIPAVTNLAGMGVRSAPGTFGKSMAPTEAQLEAAKNIQYTQAESLPIAINSQAIDLLGKNIKSNLGISPKLAPNTFGVLDDFSKYPFDSPVNVQELRTIQRSLGEVKNNDPSKTERLMARKSLDTVNYFLENLDQIPSGMKAGTPGQAAEFSRLIKEANGNNAALENSRDFTKRGMEAQYEANAANSGMNTGGRLNAKVSQILKNPKLMRGMDADTIEALKEYNGGSPTSNARRLVENALGGGGGLGMVAAEGLGQVFGVPAGVLPGIGVTLKSLGNQSSLNKFKNIGNMIRANSPLARAGEISFNGGGLLGRPRIAIPPSPQANAPQQ